MNRRAAIASLLALPALARAQPRLPLLGFLSPVAPQTDDEFAKSRAVIRLRELGWQDGRTYRIERAFSGHEDRLGKFAAALVEKRVDAILAVGPEAALAAARLTNTIPIVFWGVGYPVEQGLVQSLGRPGRNVTGVTAFTDIGIYQKQLELLQQIVPNVKRVAWIRTPSAIVTMDGSDSGTHVPVLTAAKTIGVEVTEMRVHGDADFDGVFHNIVAARVQALSVGGTMLTLRNRDRIIEFANRERIPAMYFDRSWVEVGGLASYGANALAGYLRSMEILDRVLRGAQPADIPVERPSAYEITLNLKTAKQIGLTIPHPVLLRADRVIE